MARGLLGLAAAAACRPVWAEAPASIVSLLKAEPQQNACGRRESAVRGTLARIEGMAIPTEGKLILVNIASRMLAAYEDGNPVIESRVVIGKEGWRTPDLTTSVDFVRVNPTWTVPESIVKSNRWRAKLADSPSYFARNGFDVVVRGRAVDPRDIDDADVARAVFVQRPSGGNALGRVKIGLVNAGNIYLHDTNDKAAFDRRGVESHGCIRVEAIRELAAWILGKDKADISALIKDDDRANRKPAGTVRVVVGYFTAWPDGEGRVHYYRDIYNRDQRAAGCRRDDGESVESPYGENPRGVSYDDERPADDAMPAVQQEDDAWPYD